VIDPGFGFGKTLEHNVELLRGLREFERLDLPVLVGISRKGTLGTLTADRRRADCRRALRPHWPPSRAGASIVRVHDVATTVDALKVWRAVESTGTQVVT
jgi:dihydropteroate synthase